jgi:hypothetical protein
MYIVLSYSSTLPSWRVQWVYGLKGRDSIPGSGKGFFSTLQSPDKLWYQPSLLPSGDGEVDNYPHSSSEFKNCGLYFQHLRSLHDVVLNLLGIRTPLSLIFATKLHSPPAPR